MNTQCNCSLAIRKKQCPRGVFDCHRCMTKMKNTGQVWRLTTTDYINDFPHYFPPFDSKLYWDGEVPNNRNIYLPPHPQADSKCRSDVVGLYELPETTAPNPITEAYIDLGTITYANVGPNEFNAPEARIVHAVLYHDVYWRLRMQWSYRSNSNDPGFSFVIDQVNAEYISSETSCFITEPATFQLVESASVKVITPDVGVIYEEVGHPVTVPQEFTFYHTLIDNYDQL